MFDSRRDIESNQCRKTIIFKNLLLLFELWPLNWTSIHEYVSMVRTTCKSTRIIIQWLRDYRMNGTFLWSIAILNAWNKHPICICIDLPDRFTIEQIQLCMKTIVVVWWSGILLMMLVLLLRRMLLMIQEISRHYIDRSQDDNNHVQLSIWLSPSHWRANLSRTTSQFVQSIHPANHPSTHPTNQFPTQSPCRKTSNNNTSNQWKIQRWYQESTISQKGCYAWLVG